MHVTVDDVNFCDILKCLHGLLIACDMAFYAMIVVYRFYCMALYHCQTRRHVINKNTDTPSHLLMHAGPVNAKRIDKCLYSCIETYLCSCFKPLSNERKSMFKSVDSRAICKLLSPRTII